jgi:hydroxymethylbilane synthase
VRNRILKRFPDLKIAIKTITTSADADPGKSIRTGSTTGVFVKEIEDALIAGEIDLAVHSLKDVPSKIPSGLKIAAVPNREDARDALISKDGYRRLEQLPSASVIGTSSMRRLAQILSVRPDLTIKDIRGNVDTRLRRMEAGEYDAVILACAGMNRLGLQDKISARLSYQQMLPAPGQGALGLETRRDDIQTVNAVADLHHHPTSIAVNAERTFLRRLGGGCSSPIAAHAHLSGQIIAIEGLVASDDGAEVIRDALSGPSDNAEELAVALAEKVLAAGGESLLRAPNR